MRLLASVALAALVAACSGQEEDAAPEPIIADAADCARVDAAMLGATEASGKWVVAAEELPA